MKPPKDIKSILKNSTESEKGESKLPKRVKWVDDKDTGKIDNEKLMIQESSSLSKSKIKENMAQHIENGYTSSEAASLESSATTLDGKILLSGFFADKTNANPNEVDDFYKSKSEICAQKNARDNNRYSFWNIGGMFLGGAAIVGLGIVWYKNSQ